MLEDTHVTSDSNVFEIFHVKPLYPANRLGDSYYLSFSAFLINRVSIVLSAIFVWSLICCITCRK